MTKASYICKFINDFPDTWEEQLKNKRIIIKKEGPLAIFNYGIKADFRDSIVQEARGIIINYETKEVVCWPFRKFGKYNDSYADKIDWSTAKVLEKIDGSIIKLWFNKLEGKWIFSTNGIILAENAHIRRDDNRSFLDLIIATDQYRLLKQYIDFGYLDKNTTYIFELVSPENVICINYHKDVLFHIGTRNNLTGEESSYTLSNIPHPREYCLNNLEECITASNFANSIGGGKISACTNEGFVVVDANFNRIKIKTPIYSIIHNIVSGSDVSRKLLITLIHDKRIDIESMCEEFPDIAHIMRYYSFKYDELIYQMNLFINKSREIYKRLNKDRKAFSSRIPNCKFTNIAYMAIDNDYDLFTILERTRKGCIGTIVSMIPKYESEKFVFDWNETDKEDNNNDNN